MNDLRAQLERLGYAPYVTSGTTPNTSIEELRRTFRKKKEKHSATAIEQRLPTSRDAAAERVRLEEAVVYRRGLPRVAKPSRRKEEQRNPVALTDVTDGEVVKTESGGTCYALCRPACAVPEAHDLGHRFAARLADDSSGLSRHVSELLPGVTSLGDMVFMDIETTGLSTAPLFLIGIMTWKDEGFIVRQFLARDYAEERPVIAAFVEACASRRLLVTFNGKSFDFPYIRTRAAATGMPFALDPAHLDLLHVSRRFWRDRLPNCKLQTLERFVCHRQRHDDIPGSEIPEAYHAYVRTDDACQIVQVLEHNMLDLITLADIMTRLPDEY